MSIAQGQDAISKLYSMSRSLQSQSTDNLIALQFERTHYMWFTDLWKPIFVFKYLLCYFKCKAQRRPLGPFGFIDSLPFKKNMQHLTTWIKSVAFKQPSVNRHEYFRRFHKLIMNYYSFWHFQ